MSIHQIDRQPHVDQVAHMANINGTEHKVELSSMSVAGRTSTSSSMGERAGGQDVGVANTGIPCSESDVWHWADSLGESMAITDEAMSTLQSNKPGSDYTNNTVVRHIIPISAAGEDAVVEQPSKAESSAVVQQQTTETELHTDAVPAVHPGSRPASGQWDSIIAESTTTEDYQRILDSPAPSDRDLSSPFGFHHGERGTPESGISGGTARPFFHKVSRLDKQKRAAEQSNPEFGVEYAESEKDSVHDEHDTQYMIGPQTPLLEGVRQVQPSTTTRPSGESHRIRSRPTSSGQALEFGDTTIPAEHPPRALRRTRREYGNLRASARHPLSSFTRVQGPEEAPQQIRPALVENEDEDFEEEGNSNGVHATRALANPSPIKTRREDFDKFLTNPEFGGFDPALVPRALTVVKGPRKPVATAPDAPDTAGPLPAPPGKGKSDKNGRHILAIGAAQRDRDNTRWPSATNSVVTSVEPCPSYSRSTEEVLMRGLNVSSQYDEVTSQPSSASASRETVADLGVQLGRREVLTPRAAAKVRWDDHNVSPSTGYTTPPRPPTSRETRRNPFGTRAEKPRDFYPSMERPLPALPSRERSPFRFPRPRNPQSNLESGNGLARENGRRLKSEEVEAMRVLQSRPDFLGSHGDETARNDKRGVKKGLPLGLKKFFASTISKFKSKRTRAGVDSPGFGAEYDPSSLSSLAIDSINHSRASTLLGQNDPGPQRYPAGGLEYANLSSSSRMTLGGRARDVLAADPNFHAETFEKTVAIMQQFANDLLAPPPIGQSFDGPSLHKSASSPVLGENAGYPRSPSDHTGSQQSVWMDLFLMERVDNHVRRNRLSRVPEYPNDTPEHVFQGSRHVHSSTEESSMEEQAPSRLEIPGQIPNQPLSAVFNRPSTPAIKQPDERRDSYEYESGDSYDPTDDHTMDGTLDNATHGSFPPRDSSLSQR